nr:hypothetical protein [Tanacetum cinerariifolium]
MRISNGLNFQQDIGTGSLTPLDIQSSENISAFTEGVSYMYVDI